MLELRTLREVGRTEGTVDRTQDESFESCGNGVFQFYPLVLVQIQESEVFEVLAFP